MRLTRLTIICSVVFTVLFSQCVNQCLAASQEELIERIRLLEIQIQQLKELKARQKLSVDKEQQCLKPLGNEKFCKCIAEALPQEVSFEQYVHFLVTTKETLQYDAMKPESRQAVDAAITARDTCVNKGW